MLPVEAYDRPVQVEWKLMASMRADSPSTSNVELAKRVGVNVNTITRWLKDPGYQRYENWILTKEFEVTALAARDEGYDVQETLQERSPEMLERLYGIIQSVNDPKLEAELCQDWLDRGGFAAQRKVAASNQKTVVLTGDAMEVIFRRMHEAGLAGPTTTVEPSPVALDGRVLGD